MSIAALRNITNETASDSGELVAAQAESNHLPEGIIGKIKLLITQSGFRRKIAGLMLASREAGNGDNQVDWKQCEGVKEKSFTRVAIRDEVHTAVRRSIPADHTGDQTNTLLNKAEEEAAHLAPLYKAAHLFFVKKLLQPLREKLMQHDENDTISSDQLAEYTEEAFGQFAKFCRQKKLDERAKQNGLSEIFEEEMKLVLQSQICEYIQNKELRIEGDAAQFSNLAKSNPYSPERPAVHIRQNYGAVNDVNSDDKLPVVTLRKNINAAEFHEGDTPLPMDAVQSHLSPADIEQILKDTNLQSGIHRPFAERFIMEHAGEIGLLVQEANNEEEGLTLKEIRESYSQSALERLYEYYFNQNIEGGQMSDEEALKALEIMIQSLIDFHLDEDEMEFDVPESIKLNQLNEVNKTTVGAEGNEPEPALIESSKPQGRFARLFSKVSNGLSAAKNFTTHLTRAVVNQSKDKVSEWMTRGLSIVSATRTKLAGVMNNLTPNTSEKNEVIQYKRMDVSKFSHLQNPPAKDPIRYARPAAPIRQSELMVNQFKRATLTNRESNPAYARPIFNIDVSQYPLLGEFANDFSLMIKEEGRKFVGKNNIPMLQWVSTGFREYKNYKGISFNGMSRDEIKAIETELREVILTQMSNVEDAYGAARPAQFNVPEAGTDKPSMMADFNRLISETAKEGRSWISRLFSGVKPQPAMAV